MLVSTVVVGQNYTLTDDDVVVSEGVITSCSYDFSNKEINIPSILDGQTVVGISSNLTHTGVFMQKGLTTVTLPSTLVSIGASTFEGNNIEYIELPDGLEFIGVYAFKDNLIDILEIPGSVRSIGSFAFENNQLSSVSFSSSSNLDIINAQAFIENLNLTSITLPTHTEQDFVSYLSETGEVILPGESITDFSKSYFSNVPYTLQDDDVVVSSGVIKSCSYSFERKSLIIPEILDGQQVLAIGSIGGIDGLFNGVFSHKSLRHVEFPESLRSIGRFAFLSNSLHFIELPNALDYLGIFAFAYNRLNEVHIPQEVTLIESSVFKSNSIRTLELPESVEFIEQSAFSNNKIESLIIPKSIRRIESNAFINNLIETVIFEPKSNIRTIESDAFSGNASLIQVQLPTHNEDHLSVYIDVENQQYQPGEFITDFSLTYHAKLSHTLRDEDVEVVDGIIISCNYDFSDDNSLVIPKRLDDQVVTGIASNWNGVFQGKGLVSVKIPNSLKFLGERAFVNNSISFLDLPDGLETIERSAFERNELVHLTIPASVRYIRSNAFLYNKLSNIQFKPNAVLNAIEDNAFGNNPNLSSYQLPTNITPGFESYLDGRGIDHQPGDYILEPEGALYAKIPYTLTDADVVVVDGVIKSCSYDFESKNIVIPSVLDGQLIIGIQGYYTTGVFQSKGIVSVKLPESLLTIEKNSFKDNNIIKVFIPKGVKRIGDEAFESNSLNEVIIENESEIFYIGYSAFRHKISSNSINIILPTHAHPDFINYGDSNGNRYDENEIFNHNHLQLFARVPYTLTDEDVVVEEQKLVSCSFDPNYKVLSIPDVLDGQVVIELNDYLFYNMELDSVRLPHELRSIGRYTFSKNILTSIEFPSKLESIGQNAFSFNLFKFLEFPASIKLIRSKAFYANVLLDVSFSAFGLIEAKAFESNYYLKSIVFPDNADENFINYGDSDRNRYDPNQTFSDFSKSYYSRILYTLGDEDVEMKGDTIVATHIDSWNLVINIPETLKGQPVSVIDNDSYYNGSIFENKKIDSLIFPNGLKSIGSYVFQDHNLEEVVLPDGLVHIGLNAFKGNYIQKVILPESIQRIENWAFDMKSLNEVEFAEPSNILYIGYSVFGSSGSQDPINLPIHADEGFIGYKDSQGKLYNESDAFEGRSKSLTTRILYTLTDYDVIVEQDTLKSCEIDNKYNVIVIPEILDGQNVRAIADYDWNTQVSNLKGLDLDSVALPAGLEYIGKSAFSYNSITSINFPESLKVINEDAFKSNKLQQINVPRNVHTIGKLAFQYNNIADVIFEPNSHINLIDKGAFASNYSLGSITLPTNEHPDFIEYVDEYGYRYQEGQEFERFNSYLARQVPYELTDTDVKIVNGVIIECNYDFFSKYIIIPDTLQDQAVVGIGGALAFSGVHPPFKGRNLDSLRLPSGLRFIGPYGLSHNRLRTLALPDSLDFIKDNALYNNRLINIKLPAGIKQVGERAFADNDLIGVHLYESSEIQMIGKDAFTGNHNLYGVLLPTHKDSDFYSYQDSGGTNYFPGEMLIDFSKSYKMRKTPHPLIIEMEGQGIITPGVGSHEYNNGDRVSLVAYTNAHWEFEKWVVDDVEYFNPIIEVTIEKDTTRAKAYFISILAIQNDNQSHEIFHAFPVPFDNELIINKTANSNVVSMAIYTQQGILIHEITTNMEGQFKISTADFPSGIYFVKVVNNVGQSEVKKVLKN